MTYWIVVVFLLQTGQVIEAFDVNGWQDNYAECRRFAEANRQPGVGALCTWRECPIGKEPRVRLGAPLDVRCIE